MWSSTLVICCRPWRMTLEAEPFYPLRQQFSIVGVFFFEFYFCILIKCPTFLCLKENVDVLHLKECCPLVYLMLLFFSNTHNYYMVKYPQQIELFFFLDELYVCVNQFHIWFACLCVCMFGVSPCFSWTSALHHHSGTRRMSFSASWCVFLFFFLF